MNQVDRALEDVSHIPFWLDSGEAPQPTPPLIGATGCDLAVVGGGFTGLWAALLAKERDPSTDVVLLEADRIGWQASGRNGGFCMATLTHGSGNGYERYPDEMATLERLGLANLDAIEEAVGRYGIECDWSRSGEMNVAVAPHQVATLVKAAEEARRIGRRVTWFDAEALRDEVRSPTYLAALWERDTCAMIDPARLAWGLARACAELGVRLYEGSRMITLRRFGEGMVLTTPEGTVHARQVVLATNAFPSPLRSMRRRVIPVYDYVLVTEPLTAAQWESVGWRHRQGLSDCGNKFHYYRATEDGRILWGGYDAVYHFGNAIRPALEDRPQTFATLAQHFAETFPQLAGVRFTHAWGGVIDTCTSFCQFCGTGKGGRVAYAVGYTGMGVGESRFGAQVALDLLSGEKTELTELILVKEKPMAWPPEPLRAPIVWLTSWSLHRADSNGGRRNIWLRLLDRLGVGFDS